MQSSEILLYYKTMTLFSVIAKSFAYTDGVSEGYNFLINDYTPNSQNDFKIDLSQLSTQNILKPSLIIIEVPR